MACMWKEHWDMTDIEEPENSRSRRKRARCRLITSIWVHLFGVVQLLITLLLFAMALHARYFFAILVLVLGFNTCLCARMAWKEQRLQGWYCRLPMLILGYGLFQWLHVEHMKDLYRRRCGHGGDQETHDQNQEFFHRKILDGISVGFPFALVTIFAFFLLDKNSPEACPWHNAVSTGFLLGLVRVVMASSFIQSCASIALGALEIDYRINRTIAHEIENSVCKSCIFFVFRWLEACFNISLLATLCVFLRPLVETAIEGHPVGPFLLCMPVMAELFINLFILCFASGSELCTVHGMTSKLLVACAALAVNPVALMGESRHRIEARRVGWGFFGVKVARAVCIACLVWVSSSQVFPSSCKSPSTVLSYFMQHQVLLLYMNASSFAGLLMVTFSPVVRPHLLLRLDKLLCPSEAEPSGLHSIPLVMTPFGRSMRSRTMSNAQLAEDLSCSLVRLGGVFSNNMIESRQDFEIEVVGDDPARPWLGYGEHGLVARVKLPDKQATYTFESGGEMGIEYDEENGYVRKVEKGGQAEQRSITTEMRIVKFTPNGAEQPVIYSKDTKVDLDRAQEGRSSYNVTLVRREDRYALKLVNDESCTREVHLLNYLTQVSHAFIVRLKLAFEVPPGTEFHYNDGKLVTHPEYPTRTFQFAIMMTLVEGGTLESYIKAMREQEQDPVCLAKRLREFGAEIAEALSFLHEFKIAYRDLKPDNIMVKMPNKSKRQRPHICLTDFGFAKQATGDNPLLSLAGNPATAAPEVMRNTGKWTFPEPYDLSVDVFSYGCNYLLMSGVNHEVVRCCKDETFMRKRLKECQEENGVPSQVIPLLDWCLTSEKSKRPSMNEVLGHKFFTGSFIHKDESFDPIDIQAFKRDAER